MIIGGDGGDGTALVLSIECGNKPLEYLKHIVPQKIKVDQLAANTGKSVEASLP